ncbi:hypothetical protein [Erwinia aphidicola]|uniref:hypothetical protein n=1 Tax=Erwinia aphidicola TaxID=68334 RepID=UPI0020A090C1|nr:hypothetical protein [Erwinia aphidicola]MCP2230137.1 hypothetical protein [Erwinia aphidicola]
MAHSPPQPDKINGSETKTALHRTRLPFLDLKVFSVSYFYKPHRQPAPPLGLCGKTQTEKIEKDFSIFQFSGSLKDRLKIVSIRYERVLHILRQIPGSLMGSLA